MRKYGGHLPDGYEALLALPGVGDYTAGALMSIAFQRSYPAIDGNAHRVLYRLFTPKNDRELRQEATLLVPRLRPGYFNQGLMELGATICIPKFHVVRAARLRLTAQPARWVDDPRTWNQKIWADPRHRMAIGDPPTGPENPTATTDCATDCCQVYGSFPGLKGPRARACNSR